MKDWELDRNMYDNGEDVGAIFEQGKQYEKDIDRIRADYDAWLRDIQDNTRPGLSPIPGGTEKPKTTRIYDVECRRTAVNELGNTACGQYPATSTGCSTSCMGSRIIGYPSNWSCVRYCGCW